MHDDITCVVFFLKGNRSNDGFTALQGYKVQGVKEKQNVENPAQWKPLVVMQIPTREVRGSNVGFRVW